MRTSSIAGLVGLVALMMVGCSDSGRGGAANLTAPRASVTTVQSWITGPSGIFTKDTYEFDAHANFSTSPDSAWWYERFCGDGSCSSWGLAGEFEHYTAPFYRTLTPDCSGAGDATYELYVNVAGVVSDVHETLLCAYR